MPSWLWIFAPRVQYLDYYLVQDGQLVRDQHTGESRPFQERPLPSRSYLFSLPVDGKPMTLYVRMTSNHPLMAWFDQIDEAGLVGLEKPAYAFGMLLGGMLLLLMYNLIRFAYCAAPAACGWRRCTRRWRSAPRRTWGWWRSGCRDSSSTSR